MGSHDGLRTKAVQDVESKGIGTVRGNWLVQVPGNIMAWCLWETENLEALKAIFDHVAENQFADWEFRTEFTPVEQAYPLPDEASLPRVADI